jgi:hypothetical protein
MKTQRILFWTTTMIIVLFEGVMPLFTFNSEMAREGLRHLGYPPYFGALLLAFKIPGVIALAVPKTPARIKEWAYAGFGFDFISACISYLAVDDFGVAAFLPLIFFGLLVVSYLSYHKLAVYGKSELAYN